MLGVWVLSSLCIAASVAAPDAPTLRQYYAQPPSQWPAPHIDVGVVWQELAPLPSTQRALAADPSASLWDDVENPRVVALGAKLFADPRLSRKQQVSCLSCHQPARSFTDGRALAVGEDGLMGSRRSMPLFGAVGASAFFWDGRAATLMEQVLQPIHHPREMNFSSTEVLQRLRVEDQQDFLQAFGALPDVQLLARALSAYVASLRPPRTRFDDFLETQNTQVLSDQELIGLHLFRTKGRCLNCHSGPLLTDQQFHHIGLSFAGRRNQDLGRYEVTRLEKDAGLFRTPSLRGVAAAGPWMHNGLFPTLRGVITMYAAGMPNLTRADALPFPIETSKHIKKLDLSEEEILALEAFLQVL